MLHATETITFLCLAHKNIEVQIFKSKTETGLSLMKLFK